MSITQTTLLAGPAAATFLGHTFFARDGILVTPALEVAGESAVPVESDAQGSLDATMPGAVVKIQFTPSGPVGDLPALYPWAQGAPGTPLFGAGDVPLVLVAANGVRLTFAAAAIVQMPDLLLGAREPVAGAVTFLALGSRSLGLTAANRLVTIDTAAVPLAPAGSPQLADDYAITWGAAPWVNLRSRDGVRVRFAMTTRPVVSDANGLLDLTLERLAVSASFVPASPNGPAEGDLAAALQWQGANALPGRPLSQTGETLTIAGSAFSVELPLANVTGGGLEFDLNKPRLGELNFVAERALLNAAEAMVVLGE
jgi:hypothetical protein